MLRRERAPADFLSSPVEEVRIANGRCLSLEQPGSFVGPYKLLQEIGEGGMGVVFMAEQAEPLRRTVALKIIKPGMDTPSGHRPLRSRAAGTGDDGPSEHRQSVRRRHDR